MLGNRFGRTQGPTIEVATVGTARNTTSQPATLDHKSMHRDRALGVDWVAVRQDYLKGVSTKDIAARHLLKSHNHVAVVAKRYRWLEGGTGYPGNPQGLGGASGYRMTRALERVTKRYRLSRGDDRYWIVDCEVTANESERAECGLDASLADSNVISPKSVQDRPAVNAQAGQLSEVEARHRRLADAQVRTGKRLLDKLNSVLSRGDLTVKDYQAVASSAERASMLISRGIEIERKSYGLDRQDASGSQTVVQIAVLVDGKQVRTIE